MVCVKDLTFWMLFDFRGLALGGLRGLEGSSGFTLNPKP